MIKFCSSCAVAFPPSESIRWPYTCASCQHTVWMNPLPVAICILPVDDGLLLIRRGIKPGYGMLAFPGGYVDHNEKWKVAAARELYEEAGVVIRPETLQIYEVYSAPDNTLVLFALAPRMASSELPPWTPNSETLERCIVNEPIELAFDGHTRMMKRFFASRGTPFS